MMYQTYRTSALALALSLVAAAGCSDEPNAAPLGPDARPALGPQIDRAGRPAISTALIATFSADADARSTARNAYNRAAPAEWTAFAPEVTTSLGILDSLNGVCGDQLLAADTGTDIYAALRGVLLDDRLYVNSNATTCGIYLGVEGEAIDALAAGEGGCGGRTPNDDVIERSYSVLASPDLAGIDDLVTGDERDHSTTDFPFLAGPND